MATRIEVVLDHSLDSSDKTPSGKVEVETTDGHVYSNRVDYPLGSPERPMTFDDCARKFRSCASSFADRLADSQIERTIDLINRLEDLNDVGEVMRSLAP
jgi:2-methylcitrate dehydratase PrpD